MLIVIDVSGGVYSVGCRSLICLYSMKCQDNYGCLVRDRAVFVSRPVTPPHAGLKSTPLKLC